MAFYEKLIVGAILKFLQGPYAGPLWKVVELLRFEASNGELWVRARLDKDTKQLGDEIVLEFYPADPRVVYVVTKYNEFAEDAQPLPPPVFVNLEDEQVLYKCLDPSATDENNPGYDATYLGEGINSATGVVEKKEQATMHHWEYENETQDRVLQIFYEDGWVEMYTGVKCNVSEIMIF